MVIRYNVMGCFDGLRNRDRSQPKTVEGADC